MPVYEYCCINGHWSSDFRSISRRAEPRECPECGESALLGIHGRTEPTAREGSALEKRTDYLSRWAWRDAVCKNPQCGWQDLECIERVNGEIPFDYEVACEDCGGPTDLIAVDLGSIDRFSERFPYFDRGLGMVLTSKAHRREMCKRRGVVPIDGDIDVAGWASKKRALEAKEDAEVDRYFDRLENSPEFRKYRVMRDKGVV